MKVSWDDDIPNIWKNRKCSKPPIRIVLTVVNKEKYRTYPEYIVLHNIGDSKLIDLIVFSKFSKQYTTIPS